MTTRTEFAPPKGTVAHEIYAAGFRAGLARGATIGGICVAVLATLVLLSMVKG